MKLTLGDYALVNDNIHIALASDVPLAGAHVVAHAHVPGGAAVPARVLADAEGAELIVANLTVKQTVHIEVYASSPAPAPAPAEKNQEAARPATGTLLGAATLEVSAKAQHDCFEAAKKAKTPATSRFELPSRIEIFEHDTVCKGTGEGLFSCAAVCEFAPGENPQLPVALEVLDVRGKALAKASTLITADSCRTLPNGTSSRRISFTMSVPEGAHGALVWVRFGQATAAASETTSSPAPASHPADTFYQLTGWRLWYCRDLWYQKIASQPGGPVYPAWFMAHRATDLQLAEQRLAHFDLEPKFSIIVPLFKTPKNFFVEMAESVLAQTYANWELVLVNASPEDEKLRALVEEYCARDNRLVHVVLDGNYGITKNTNAGVAVATGEFLSFFDHDDVLEPDCLYEYVKGVNAYPETDLLYCDEDKLVDGQYQWAYLKPDFDWEMICCRNFVTHLLTVRKELVDAFNNEPGSEFDGAQDYHMTMAIAEQARNIYHARRVLYHWRIHKNSTAANSAAKPYTVEAGRRAIQAHLDRCHIPATAVCDEEKDNFYHVDYEIPAGSKVSIVIPNKDAKDVLKRCVDSIFEKTTYPHFELVIVENNSTTQEIFDYYQELTAAHTNVRVVTYEGSFNYSAINNLGVAATTGTHLLFLNNDTQVIEPNWLQLLMGPLVRPGVGAVGAKLLYPNGLIQHVGVILSGDGFGHVSRLYPGDELGYGEYPSLMAREMLAVTGACLMTTRAYFDAVGGFDEGLPVAYNDVDLCLRLREAGLVSVVNPRALLYHYESVSRGYDEDSPQKRARLEREKGLMMRRWAHWYVQGDPYYNANCAPGSDLYQLDMRPIY